MLTLLLCVGGGGEMHNQLSYNRKCQIKLSHSINAERNIYDGFQIYF